jgi:hypothetical protein
MRGSSAFTVIPSVVRAAGGVANGVAAAVAAAVGLGTKLACAAGAPAGALTLQPSPGSTAAVTARLPVISVTRRRSSRRVMKPSRKSSMCSPMM